MIRSKRLDDDGVAKLKPGAKRVTLPDPELRGHYIRMTPNGVEKLLGRRSRSLRQAALEADRRAADEDRRRAAEGAASYPLDPLRRRRRGRGRREL